MSFCIKFRSEKLIFAGAKRTDGLYGRQFLCWGEPLHTPITINQYHFFMKTKLLKNKLLRVLLLLTTTLIGGGNFSPVWGETVTLVSGSGTSGYAVPEGWTSSGTVEGGSYLKLDNGTITSPVFAPHNSLSFTYTVATFGSGTNHPLTIRILDASTNAVIVEETTATPTSTSYISTGSPISLGNITVNFNPLAELNQCVLNPAYGFVVNVIDVL